ncbi:MAG: hypothetical protein AAF433_07975 [Bacteroidota bacterium]
MEETPEKQTEAETQLSKWLDSIQQDSWQLELLVSGFAIFLLIGAIEPVGSYEVDLMVLSTESDYSLLLANLYYPGRIALYLLIICLIGHVLLRGLWIAAIGLRYVSGDIDYEQLGYKPKFKAFLHRRIGPFDGYIGRLERACSVAFGVSFLVIFALISLASYIFCTAVLQILIRLVAQMDSWGDASLNGDDIFGLLVVLIGLIYLIDFASLGWFKRKNWSRRWYYPIYRLMGWLTLARVYRPLYHNLIDNRFGRRLGIMLPIVLSLTLLVVSFRYVGHTYYPIDSLTGSTIRSSWYDDLERTARMDGVWNITLDSRYVGADNYLEIFAPYLPRSQDQVIKHLYPTLTPGRNTGLRLDGVVTVGSTANNESDADSLLQALSSIHELYLNDSLMEDVSWRFYYHPQRRQRGLLYVMPAHDLSRGEHRINVKRQWYNESRDSLYWAGTSQINFYR